MLSAGGAFGGSDGAGCSGGNSRCVFADAEVVRGDAGVVCLRIRGIDESAGEIGEGGTDRQGDPGIRGQRKRRSGVAEQAAAAVKERCSAHGEAGFVLGDVPFREIGVAPVQKGGGIRELIGGLLFHDDADQADSTALASGHQGLSGVLVVAGFAADDALTRRLFGDESVLVADCEVVRLRGRRAEMIGRCVADPQTERIVEEGPGNQRHIVRRCVVILIVKAIGVDKVRASAAELLRLFVHQIGEGSHTAGGLLRNRGGSLVGGPYHDAIEGLLHGDRLSDIEADVRAVSRHGMHCLLGHRDRVRGIKLLRREQNGHHFRDAGGIQMLVHVFLVQDGTSVGIDENRAFSADFLRFGPGARRSGLLSRRIGRGIRG